MADLYAAKDFKHLLGTSGFSDALLTNHFTLYEGYVKNTNLILEKLKALTPSEGPGTPEYNELRRRFAWEWNGMRLHELYFGNMASSAAPLGDGQVRMMIERAWGSVENWKKDFVATGLMRGIGWVILAYDPERRALFNTWINEHDVGHLSGARPLVVMDVFEHAFMLDYGLKRADYIEAFFRSLDWSVAEKRLAG